MEVDSEGVTQPVVLGLTTDKMASTGTFEENLYAALTLLGIGITFLGYKKLTLSKK